MDPMCSREKDKAFKNRLAKSMNQLPSIIAEDVRLQRLEKSIDRICANRLNQCERKQKEVERHLAKLEKAKRTGSYCHNFPNHSGDPYFNDLDDRRFSSSATTQSQSHPPRRDRLNSPETQNRGYTMLKRPKIGDNRVVGHSSNIKPTMPTDKNQLREAPTREARSWFRLKNGPLDSTVTNSVFNPHPPCSGDSAGNDTCDERTFISEMKKCRYLRLPKQYHYE